MVEDFFDVKGGNNTPSKSHRDTIAKSNVSFGIVNLLCEGGFVFTEKAIDCDRLILRGFAK